MMHKGLSQAEPIADVVEAIPRLCQLCTEYYNAPTLPMTFLTLPVAYSIWTYMEHSIHHYVAYQQQDPHWLAKVCPTAKYPNNRKWAETTNAPPPASQRSRFGTLRLSRQPVAPTFRALPAHLR